MQEARGTEAACIGGRGTHWRAIHSAGDAVVLRVVEEVEVLPTEVDCGALTEREALEEAEVEVEAAWTVKRVSANVTEGEACGGGKRASIEENRPADTRVVFRVRSMRVANQVGTR